MVVGAVGAAQGARAVVGDGDHDCVVVLAESADLLEKPADLRIGVWSMNPAYSSIQPRGQPPLVGVEFVPDPHARIPGRPSR